jgi:hypothetical protein
MDACVSGSSGSCGSSGNPRPFDGQFPIDYAHILRMTNDAYSNYDSLQTAFKVRDFHGFTGQFNYVWSKTLDTGSANRGGDFLTKFQNPYDISKNYALSNFDTPWNVNFTVVYDAPKIHGIPKLIGEGWSINSLFRAQAGRPFTAYASGDPSNQGMKTTYANYDGGSLDYHYDINHLDQFFNTAAFTKPDSSCGCVGNAGRNSLRQPGIAQLDMGIFKAFKFKENYALKFKWEVFNVLNHPMFAYETGNVKSSGFGHLFATPDVGIGLNPILGTGAQRNMQFGVEVDF